MSLTGIPPPAPAQESIESLAALNQALLPLAAKDLRYVLVSREPLTLDTALCTAPTKRLALNALTPAQASEACGRLLPSLEKPAREQLVALAAGRLGRLAGLARLPPAALKKLLEATGATGASSQPGSGAGSERNLRLARGGQEVALRAGAGETAIEALVLKSLSRRERDFLHQLGPLFAVEAPFEDRLAMQLLGPSARDALERADVWFRLLTLGVARRTDEGLFVLEPRYALAESIRTSRSARQLYLDYWAAELAALGERAPREEPAALAAFDRWRPHFDALLAVWLGPKGPKEGEDEGADEATSTTNDTDCAALSHRVAGTLQHLLSRRLGEATLLRVLAGVAAGCDRAARPESTVRAQLDHAGYLLLHGRWSDAEGPARDAHALAADLPRAHAQLALQAASALGLAMEGAGRREEAAVLYRSAVGHGPSRSSLAFVADAAARLALLAEAGVAVFDDAESRLASGMQGDKTPDKEQSKPAVA
jgi:hypothetical protein